MVKYTLVPAPTRREFCACCSRAAGLLALGTVAGCGDNPNGPSGNTQPLPSVSSTVNGRTVTVPVGTGSPVAAAGSLAITQTSIGGFLLARIDAGTLMVLTAICTHESCTITRTDGSQFVCPCHGSTYTTSGGVVMGPAPRSLQQFPAAINGDSATFTA